MLEDDVETTAAYPFHSPGAPVPRAVEHMCGGTRYYTEQYSRSMAREITGEIIVVEGVLKGAP